MEAEVERWDEVRLHRRLKELAECGQQRQDTNAAAGSGGREGAQSVTADWIVHSVEIECT